MRAIARFVRDRWALIVGPVLLLAVWEALSRTGAIPGTFFPPPTLVVANAGIVADAQVGLGADILITVARLAATVILAVLIGVGIGIAITRSQWAERGTGTVLAFVYPIPGVLFFPFLTFVLGRGETAVLLTATVTPLIVMIMYTAAGVNGISATLIEVADDYGCRGARRFFRVLVPGALPSIVTGIRISLGFALIAVIAIEMVGAPTGLGSFLWENWQILRVTDMYVALLFIAVLGLITTVGFDAVVGRLMPWRSDEEGAA